MRHSGLRNIMLVLLALSMLFLGCGGPSPTVFIHREYNFAFVEKVAVVPFGDISRQQGAAERATKFFITELLAAEVFDVIEPGEVDRVLIKFGAAGSTSPTKEQITDIGRELGVQALFLGSVSEASTVRSGSSQYEVVSLAVRLVEAETGQTIWSATATEKGRGFWRSIFGGSGQSQSEVMRKCIHKTLGTLIN